MKGREQGEGWGREEKSKGRVGEEGGDEVMTESGPRKGG